MQPTLTPKLRNLLIAEYKRKPSLVAFLIWEDPDGLDYAAVKWKGAAYQLRQEKMQDHNKPREDFLIVDWTDLIDL